MRRGNKEKEITYLINEQGCHVCTSHACNGDGYPYAKKSGVKWRINRLVYTLNYGEITPGQVVRHTCDNRKCINLSHLILGSVAENNKDRAERGRNRDQTGQKNNMAKLKEEQVLDIFTSTESTKFLKEKYKISSSVITSIKRGESWKNITKSMNSEKIPKEYIDKEWNEDLDRYEEIVKMEENETTIPLGALLFD